MLDALSFKSATVPVGARWVLRVLARSDEHTPSGTAPTGSLIGPDDASTALTFESTSAPGVFRAEPVLAAPGRYVAVVGNTLLDLVSFSATAAAITLNADMPDVEACNNYIGEHSWTDAQVADKLAQEIAAQAGVCRIPAAYPADLRGALLRRVQRALAMGPLALAVRESADGDAQIVIPGRDPEVRRLEGPWRRVGIG